MSKSINATTPQLEAVDRFYEAYSTRDLSNAESLYSKNFRYKGLPKTSAGPDLSEATKAEHTERLGPMLASLSKLEHVFHEVIEAPGKVVVQWTALMTPHNAATIDYDSIAIITLVEEDGEVKILEFKDIAIDPEKRAIFHKILGGEGQIA